MSNILFEELNISKELKEAVSDMGFEEATPVQSQSIKPIMEGRDVVAQAPTGTGKTCAFGIPLIERANPKDENVCALVLCPTRELCMQTSDELHKLSKFKEGIRVVPIYGGQDFTRQLYALKRHPQIIVATPGRLMDHMRRHTINLENLEFMVLDEADEMLNMGFREDIDTILESVPDQRQTMLFSATISPDIMAITKKYQKDAFTFKVEGKDKSSALIEQYYVDVKEKHKFETLTRFIDANDYKPCIIFCNTKKSVDKLDSALGKLGYLVGSIHGDMKQAARDRVMSDFKNRGIDLLVATDVAARGIDVDGIEAIFNYDLPLEDEYYIHRIGRTGRANKTGISYSFVTPGQRSRLKQIMRYASCTIVPCMAPSRKDVETSRATKLFDAVSLVIESGEQKKYEEIITKYLDKNENITALDIAAAFMKLSDKTPERKTEDFPDISEPEQRNPRGERKRERTRSVPDENSVRMFINVGTLDKINKRSMLDLFKLFTDIDVREISAIDIFDKYSFVNVPKEQAENIINSLVGVEFKGRTVAVEIANKSEKSKKSSKKIKHYTNKKK